MMMKMTRKSGYIEITDEIRERLIQHKKRTSVGSMLLLKGKRSEAPKGLNSAILNNIMNGQSKSVKKSYLEYVVQLYEALPDNVWIKLEGEVQNTIINKLTAVKIPLNRLFAGRDDLPEGFLPEKARHWTKSCEANKKIRRLWYEYLIKVCDEFIETQNNVPKHDLKEYMGKGHQQEPINSDGLQKIQRYHKYTGLLPGLIFEHYKAPDNIKPYIISSWLSGKTTMAEPLHIKWVLESCEKLLKKALYDSNRND